MSHVEFKKYHIVMSLIFFLVSVGLTSHVDFEKRPCRPVDFRGQEPQRGLCPQSLRLRCICLFQYSQVCVISPNLSLLELSGYVYTDERS